MKWNVIKACFIYCLLMSQVDANTVGKFFKASVDGFNLNISTTVVNHVYPSARIQILTPGYTITQSETGCSSSVNGYCLFKVSDRMPAIFKISGPVGTLEIKLCLSGKGPLTCQNYPVTVSAHGRIGYVLNFIDESVLLCQINLNGTFRICKDSGNTGVPFFHPAGIAMNGSRTIAYITNRDIDNTNVHNTVSLCPINSDGTFGVCQNSGHSGIPFEGPTGIVLNSTGTIAYVVNNLNDTVSLCPINPDGTFGVCESAGNIVGDPNSQPIGIAINNAGTEAYVTTSNTSNVSLCPINVTNGTFGTCSLLDNTGNFFNGPAGIIINSAGTIAYIASHDGDAVFMCAINSTDGTFNYCNNVDNTGADSGPVGIVINSAGTIAYVSNNNTNTVFLCPINTDGTFGACENVENTGAPFIGPFGMALN